jgi:hypothetical protein
MEYHEIVRSMIMAENELINHRMTWMITFNGLLYTGLGFAWGKPNAKSLIYVFCILGIIANILSECAIFGANQALMHQYDWWQANKPPNYNGPDVIGLPPLVKGNLTWIRPYLSRLHLNNWFTQWLTQFDPRWITFWTSLPIFFTGSWLWILIINLKQVPDCVSHF